MLLGLNVRFVVSSLRLCVLPLASTLIALAALVFLPQGAEVLKTITDQGLAHPLDAADDFTLALLFLLSLYAWGLANWYAARLLLQSEHGLPVPGAFQSAFEARWRKYFPRALIPLGLLPVAAALAANGQFGVASAAVAIMAVLTLLVTLRHRAIQALEAAFAAVPTAWLLGRRGATAAFLLIGGATLLLPHLVTSELATIAVLAVAFALLSALACHAVLGQLRRSRPALAGPSTRGTPGASGLLSRVPEGEELALWLGGSAAFVIVFALCAVNYSFARWLGGASILLLALAAITVYGSLCLVYLPRAAGWPALTGLAVLVVLVFAFLGVTANHGIASRRVDADQQSRVERPDAADHFARWLAAADAGDPAAPCGQAAVGSENPGPPIFLVAAEGGASRSAWWTAHVLSTLDALADGCFSGRVFAASGISGGSLGVAAWVAMLRDQREANKRPRVAGPGEMSAAPHSDPLESLAPPDQSACEKVMRDDDRWLGRPGPHGSACFLGRDFVSPVLGYLLGVDLLQRAFPIPVSAWDRSLGLENTWALDWRSLFGSDAFGQPLLDLYRAQPRPLLSRSKTAAPGPLRTDIPVLLLNTATVDRGRPAVQSPIRIADAEVDDLMDPRLRTAGLTLAGAVHNSARFPYVSPGGDVVTTDGAHFDSVVDGGYIENSGALGLAALLRSIEQAQGKGQDGSKQRQRIHVVFIANAPNEALESAADLCESGPPKVDLHGRRRWDEATIPPIGLFNARASRADAARRALMRDLKMCVGEKARRPQAFFISMASPSVREMDPVMSWYMTPAVRAMMWSAVASEPARSEALRLAEALNIPRSVASARLARFGQGGGR